MKKNSIYAVVLVFLMFGCGSDTTIESPDNNVSDDNTSIAKDSVDEAEESESTDLESPISHNSEVEDAEYESIAIDTCIDGASSDSYGVLKSGDEIVKEEKSDIDIYYADEVDRLCLASGKAYIIRLL